MGNSLPKNPTHNDYTKYFSKMFDPTDKIDYYIVASKQEKKWNDSIFFLKEKLKYSDNTTKMQTFGEISRICKKLNMHNEYFDILKEASDCALKCGMFNNCARLNDNIGDKYNENGDIENAVKYYEISLGLYNDYTCMPHLESKLRVKLSYLYIKLSKYDKAYRLLEENAKECEYNSLLDNIRDSYLFDAGLCRIMDGHDMSAIKYYDMKDVTRFKLLLDVIDAFESANEDRLTSVVSEFDKISKLTDTQTHILLQIKRNIDVSMLC